MKRDQRRIVRWIRQAHAGRRPLNISAVHRTRPDLLSEAFSMQPFWGWRRALEAAGLTYDEIECELEETVICELCGLERVSLLQHLRKQHELEAGEYQMEFPGAFVMSERCRASCRRSTQLILPHWEPLWTPEYVLDRISFFHERQIPLNATAIAERESSLSAMASVYFGSWGAALDGAGIDDADVRLCAAQQFLDRDDVTERIRRRKEQGLPLNTKAVISDETALHTAAVRRFGSWRKALGAAGVSPSAVLQKRRFLGREEEALFRRVAHVAGLSGRKHAQELERLREDVGSLVQQRYGGWRSLAIRLNLPPRRLHRSAPYSATEAAELLRERVRSGKSLAVTRIRREDSRLYYAVIRCFGTFTECYEDLGIRHPTPVPKIFRAADKDADRLVEQIREKTPRGELPRSISVGDLAGFAHLARISRKHFGGWEEGLREAGVMERAGAEAVLYGHPMSIRRDLRRVADGERFDSRRRQSLFRHTRKVYGSVLDGLMTVGMTRKAALKLRVAEGEYFSGERICLEIARLAQEASPLSHGSLNAGKHKNLPLLRSAKLVFGNWQLARDAALHAEGQE